MNKKSVKYAVSVVFAGLLLIVSNKINNGFLEDVDFKVNQELLDFYEAAHCEEIVLASQEDLNMDGKKDAVIIYKESKKSNKMTLVVTDGKSYYLTEPVPAPMENQTIKFKNIDEKEELETIVSGEKNGNVGFAIFRIEDKKAVDIFGEGMESCC